MSQEFAEVLLEFSGEFNREFQMKRLFSRSLMFLLLSTFVMVLAAGCQSSKPADEQNKAMTEQQKAIIAEHKKQNDQ
jgi:hypothetical protein